MESSALGIDSAGRKIWVVKVPPVVADKWRAVCEQSSQQEAEVGPKLGSISITSTGQGGPKFQLHLDHESTKELPQAYDMQSVTQNAPPMLAFSEAGRGYNAEGIAQHRFDVEPSIRGGVKNLDSSIKSLSRLNTRQPAAGTAATTSRTIKMMEQPKFVNIRKPVGLIEIGTRRKEAGEKRVARPPEELQAELFRLFERQAHWAFPQLQKETEQPTQHLRSVLTEIAMQNKRGPYKDLWELKREFKTGNGGGGGGGDAPNP